MKESEAKNKPPGSSQIELLGPLVDAVRDAIAADGLTQAAAAERMGVGASALNQWLGGKYRGDVDALSRAARQWLDDRERGRSLTAALPEPPAWVETPISRRVAGALSYGHSAGDLVAVIGPPGTGKTVACMRYAAARNTAWLVTASPATRSVSACLRRAAEATGITAGAYVPGIEAALADKLRASRGILVVDEANHLRTDAIETLRALHDASGCGLALVGTSVLWDRLSGSASRRPDEFAQLQSRVGRRVTVPAPSAEDADAYCAGWGEGRIESSARPLAREIAASPGGLRALAKSLRLAFAYTRGAAVTAEALKAASRDLGGAM